MSERVLLTLIGLWAIGLPVAGCAHAPPAAGCMAHVPPAPAAYPDDSLPAGPAAIVTRYQLRTAANEARKARLAILEPVVNACR